MYNKTNEDQNKGVKLLDWAYEKCLESIPTVSKTIPDLANDYLHRYKDNEVAINKLIKSPINKNTVNGFMTSVGGVIGVGFDYSTMEIIAGRANKVFDNSGVINFGYIK